MGRSLISPATGSGSLRDDLVAPSTTASPPPMSATARAAVEHRRVVRADHDQVVMVVGDGPGDRAAVQAKALDKAQPTRGQPRDGVR